MAKVTLRQTDDLQAVIDLDNELFYDCVKLTEEELSHSTWWLAELDGFPVGFAGIWLKPNENKAFLTRAAVSPVARGAGLQKRMIRARIRFAKRQGITRCYTYVWVGNFASFRSLMRCGLNPYSYRRDESVPATYLYFETEPQR